VLINALIGQHW